MAKDLPRETLVRTLTRCVNAALLLLAAAFLLRATFSPAAPRTDFNYYWLAGWMWNAAEDPYGPAFYRHGVAWFAAGYQPVFWSYPPHWLPLASLFARLPVIPASYLWSASSTAALVVACVLLARCAARADERTRSTATLLLIAYIASSLPLALALFFGQASLLLLLGVGLIAWGLLLGWTGATVAGTLIVLLKPNFGIPIALTLAVAPRGFRPACIALAALVVASLPGLLITPPAQMLAGLGRAVKFYETFEINSPVVQTGLANLVLAAGGPTLPGLPLTIAATLSSVALLLVGRFRRRPGSPHGRPVDPARRDDHAEVCRFLCASVASSVFINRLHIYDLVLLAGLLPFLLRGRPIVVACAGLGALLIFHPDQLVRLARLSGGGALSDSTIASLGALCFYLATVFACASRPGAGSAR